MKQKESPLSGHGVLEMMLVDWRPNASAIVLPYFHDTKRIRFNQRAIERSDEGI